MAALAPYAGHAQVVGLTGAPGVGKSTTTSALVTRAARARGKRVGVLAVDPSSPFSGGALLGDRVRMQDHALDPGVYIRSMASPRPPRRAGLDDPAGAAGARRRRLRRRAGRDRRRRPERGRDRRARRHHRGAARARDGRRHPGRQGRHPRDRRRLRRQQGRPRRRRPGPPRPAVHARPRPSGRDGRLAAADRQDRRQRAARASTRSSPRSTSTAPGSRRPASSQRRRTHAGARRDRGDRADRAARARGATSRGRRPTSTTLAAAVVGGRAPTRTPPPTGCWTVASPSPSTSGRRGTRG